MTRRWGATINNQIGSTWYFIKTGVGGVANFTSYLITDIVYKGHPTITVVWSAGLYGWGTYGVAHYQWVNSVCDTCNYLQYGDSAGPNASPNGTPFEYHTERALNDYYNLNVSNPNVWDEVLW